MLIKLFKAFCGTILVLGIAFALLMTVAVGSITKEGLDVREAREQKISTSREYAKTNCDYVGTIDDVLNKSSIKRSLYRCPGYRMVVI